MIDEHIVPQGWGIKPVLFHIGTIPVPAYSLFIGLALVAAVVVYYYEARKSRAANENTFYIMIAALVGGTLGAKLPIWIINYREIIAALPDVSLVLSGRTIVGGLIGGTLGVKFIKWKLGIKDRRGNLFAPAVALGIAIGRIGCFLRGCCYGIATNANWGVDFGDGILRHPTQLYESVFALGMFAYLISVKKKITRPGRLFTIFMVSYFTFRFFIEFLRDNPRVFIGLSWFQIVSFFVVLSYLGKEYIGKFKKKKANIHKT